ncbi:2TM domain-containing protein [Winogradskyella sp. DF17]|uniref:2TM domain-containing protein n=1 Tax=Winogradskyella pelagia TaxID=2819984 RepID=A0ABS3T081_9FLAO|nr:2TM domain-containing protein [Winogradskyella sp. DF17]MBO3116146.1 2TM domain-containing protein [Winogradskyella sp. DF17]
MSTTFKDKQRRDAAMKSLRRLKLFYVHFVGYIVLVSLILYNLYIVQGEYKDNIIALNIITLVLWTMFISLHAWRVFKGRLLFSKRWEEKKMSTYLSQNETTEKAEKQE